MVSFNSLLFKLVDSLLKQKQKHIVQEGFGAAPLDCLMTEVASNQCHLIWQAELRYNIRRKGFIYWIYRVIIKDLYTALQSYPSDTHKIMRSLSKFASSLTAAL